MEFRTVVSENVNRIFSSSNWNVQTFLFLNRFYIGIAEGLFKNIKHVLCIVTLPILDYLFNEMGRFETLFKYYFSISSVT